MKDDDLPRELARLRERAPAPKATFTDEVMRQIAASPKRPERARPFWRWLFAARSVTLRFRFAELMGAAAAAAVVLGAIAARPRPAQAPSVTLSAPAPTPLPPVESVRVRFALPAPQARRVALAGDFNGWRPDATPLERGADGVWTAVVPLEPGRWSYSFIVDGRSVEDPLADTWRDDGFGGRNAVVRVGDSG